MDYNYLVRFLLKVKEGFPFTRYKADEFVYGDRIWMRPTIEAIESGHNHRKDTDMKTRKRLKPKKQLIMFEELN